MTNLGSLVGRILLSALFIMAGYHKISGFEQIAGSIASKGLPMAEVLTMLTILVELGGGLLLLVGFKARYAAFVICIFTVVVSFLYHPFWAVDAAAYQSEFNAFFKNIAIAGGLLYVLIHGAGRFSLDRK